MLDWLTEKPLAVGDEAPDFELPDDNGRLIRLRDLRGKNVILIFYPGDDTPVCRKQLCEFRDSWEQVEAHNAVVFGVNPQSEKSHRRFRERMRYPFPLLVDHGRTVAEKYRTSGWVVRRTVYLIGPDGRIRYARRGKPAPAEVLASAA